MYCCENMYSMEFIQENYAKSINGRFIYDKVDYKQKKALLFKSGNTVTILIVKCVSSGW